MRLGDLFRFGVINLWRRKARTLLTALSMTIGVMCIVVLVSIGLGYEEAYSENIASMGSLTKIDVTPDTGLDRKTTALLNDKAVAAFAGIPGVEAATPVASGTAYIKCGKYVTMVKLYGIDLATAASFQLSPIEGELPGEGRRMKPQLMVTDDLAASFSDMANDWEAAVDDRGVPLVDPLRDHLRLTFDYASLTGEQTAGEDGRALPGGVFYNMDITGICSSLNYTFSTSAFLDKDRLAEWTEANSPGSTGQDASAGSAQKGGQEASSGRGSAGLTGSAGQEGETYDLVWVKADDVSKVQEISQLIQDSGYTTYSLNDMLETVKKQSRQIQGMLGAIGGVAVLVSAICIANTMMMAITERTREIGVLKVLGSQLKDICLMFLAEALMVGIIGGVSGLGLSYIMVDFIPKIFAEMELRCVMPLWLAAAGVAFGGAVAVLAALVPALRATRISPNEAIRSS